MRNRAKTIVVCMKCKTQYEKRVDALKNWNGMCRGCTNGVIKLGKFTNRKTCTDCGKVSYWIQEQERCKECLIKHRFQIEKNHPRWKGEKTGYYSLHKWVGKHLGKPKQCALCEIKHENARKFHWANISHEYQRNLIDWIRLCVKCHKGYDMGRISL